MAKSKKVYGDRMRRQKAIPDWEQEEFSSRTDIKLAAQEVTDMGDQLADLSDSKLKKLELSSDLYDALKLYKTMKPGPAIKRQKAYLGKLLRQDEELLARVRYALDEMALEEKKRNAIFHQLEKWRDRLIAEQNDALDAFLEAYPAADLQQLRQYMRNALKEAEMNKPPKAARELFQYLKTLVV